MGVTPAVSSDERTDGSVVSGQQMSAPMGLAAWYSRRNGTGSDPPAGGEGGEIEGSGADPVVRVVTLANKYGLHMRPAKKLVELANSFPCEMSIVAKGRDSDAKSILAIIGLGAECGDEVEIRALGRQANEAAEAVEELLDSLKSLK